jgi:hypothetical protein
MCYNVVSTFKEPMGLFSFYLGYRHAKKKAARRRAREEWSTEEWSEDDPECDGCGYLASQHDEGGRCPSYS